MSDTHTERRGHVQPFQHLLASVAPACFLAPRCAALHSPAPARGHSPSSKGGQRWHTLAKRQQDEGRRVRVGKGLHHASLRSKNKLSGSVPCCVLHFPKPWPDVPLCLLSPASAGPSCPLSHTPLTSSTLSLFIFFFFPFERISPMESKRHFSDSGVSHCPIPASSTLNAESFSRPIWN